ncbi:MAG: hypothetical protein ACRBBP_10795 [Bdellovibrionales bacterium]
MKKLIRLATITTISLSMGLFTGCGSSGSSSDTTVTTISCSSTPYLDTTTNTWQYSQTDTRVCTPLTTSTSVTCSSNQIKVRVPITSNTSNTALNCPVDIYGVQHCTTGTTGTPFVYGSVNTSWNSNYNNTINPNYHLTAGLYQEACVNYGDTSYGYLLQGASYWYVDQQQLQQSVYTAQYHYQLSPGETLAAVGILAFLVLATQ